MPQGRTPPPPRRRLRRFLSSIICRARAIDLDEESHRVPVYFTSLEGPLPCANDADWLSGGMTESKRSLTPLATAPASSPAVPSGTVHNDASSAKQLDSIKDSRRHQHHQHNSNGSNSSSHSHHNHSNNTSSNTGNPERNLARLVKRSLTGHRKRFSAKSRVPEGANAAAAEEQRHSVDFHTLSSRHGDAMAIAALGRASDANRGGPYAEGGGARARAGFDGHSLRAQEPDRAASLVHPAAARQSRERPLVGLHHARIEHARPECGEGA
ncbi:hypothetical protein SYNPS1DRAFT_27566 [Syncephalis pseudoplumigaleata]|uniref:Uncharacterized protein n=1 Tax=Syncephalis pseudoplumigaleata TaxID=1712513 RepID=A0A4P9Z4I0_9FUNG|nr:hypothetical protein SYNPS1DRAFT_27566 [Syncephalis pseudoplumigaleata]|eukprot:RKP26751.1 hypothetical protein SYNPS1DRAFT_27566 [Syncephalis pseudoplumigaleata]